MTLNLKINKEDITTYLLVAVIVFVVAIGSYHFLVTVPNQNTRDQDLREREIELQERQVRDTFIQQQQAETEAEAEAQRAKDVEFCVALISACAMTKDPYQDINTVKDIIRPACEVDPSKAKTFDCDSFSFN